MEPLPARLRPQSLTDFIGQEHLVGEGKVLRQAIESKQRFSFILWGPPGVGKTTLARIYAQALQAEYIELSAVSAGKDDLRKVVARANRENPPVLFLDEIHRFNKAQQDFLLPLVEQGTLTLIGATTENPSFEVIPALLSRCRVFTLHELPSEAIAQIIKRSGVLLSSNALAWLVQVANGDARQALNLLEQTANLYDEVTVESLAATMQSRTLRFDKQGEEHYNTVSAFIKSMRASSPDAALYYLARMLEAGEDPKFIARRMVIFASEDIGVAQPTALVVANAVFQAVDTIGLPECALNLAHGVVYLAQAKKDRRVYDALQAVRKDVHATGNLAIPLKLRNAPTNLMKEMGYGKGYDMYDQEGLLPKEVEGHQYFAKSSPGEGLS